MKTLLMIAAAMGLTACGTDEEKKTVPLDTNAHVVATVNAEDDACQDLSRDDEQLEEYFHDFLNRYEESGTDDLPIDILDRLIVLKKIPWQDLKTTEKQRNGFLERVTCKNKLYAYRIYVADPDTVPESQSLANPLLFKETVFHEIAHAFYGHYDDNEETVTSRYGLMAAKKDIKTTTLEAHELRIKNLFSNKDYKAHLPKRFAVSPDAEENNNRNND